MTVKCPEGHDSVSEDYCDTCGMLIAGAPAPAPGVSQAGSGADCPQCGAPKTPGAFCEVCGFNFATGTPLPSQPSPDPPPTTPVPVTSPVPRASWTVVVAADRMYYDVVRAASEGEGADIEFPAYCPERRFQLAGTEMRIGRRSPSRGLEPEIDLTGPPTDPGISRLHAVLVPTADGGWAVLDPGSANGTQVNGTDIPTSKQIPLHDGDRISLGAWTTMTIHGA
jgi:hypothetical protein